MLHKRIGRAPFLLSLVPLALSTRSGPAPTRSQEPRVVHRCPPPPFYPHPTPTPSPTPRSASVRLGWLTLSDSISPGVSIANQT